ncbi:helix-turn-helix domain-containing protein [Falsirhodobacter sp. 20TX0035]|uniref:helix-turn-helix domain-containing protein n=1 Tax=Falsirhodobacter sp. 20TX0035 TaxID=3022019 RepID=UPI00232E1DDD|nr:LysR family transcriptional regulator [Falsirhodobacter sp. 20TX0035]MDB6454516.1 LysR family transcriptional regulator [Falsirhodobacter sp. 20TX0035]
MAKKGKFARAARELDMACTPVMPAIAGLEDLGVQLFVRAMRQVSLTAAPSAPKRQGSGHHGHAGAWRCCRGSASPNICDPKRLVQVSAGRAPEDLWLTLYHPPCQARPAATFPSSLRRSPAPTQLSTPQNRLPLRQATFRVSSAP